MCEHRMVGQLKIVSQPCSIPRRINKRYCPRTCVDQPIQGKRQEQTSGVCLAVISRLPETLFQTTPEKRVSRVRLA